MPQGNKQEDSGIKIPHVMILFGDQGSKDFPSGKSRKGRGKPAQGPRTNPTGAGKAGGGTPDKRRNGDFPKWFRF